MQAITNAVEKHRQLMFDAHGGEVVNAIPDRVCTESFVRGISFDAMKRGK